jgi:CspA family cold shock protein
MSTESFIGRVKWFNNKTGYGFITITDGQRSGNDIFVHHSAINVEGQYKYLVQGEYVEFSIIDTATEKHDCQAANVSGIKGGKLMCATRHENNVARSAYKKESKIKEQSASSSSDSAPTTSPVANGKPNFRKAVSGREAPLVAESKTEESTPAPRQDKPRKQRKPAAPVEEGWTKVESKKTAPSKPKGRPAKKPEAK